MGPYPAFTSFCIHLCVSVCACVYFYEISSPAYWCNHHYNPKAGLFPHSEGSLSCYLTSCQCDYCVSGIIQYITSWNYLCSSNITPLTSILLFHLSIVWPFLLLSSIALCGCTRLVIHSPTEEHLGSFHFGLVQTGLLWTFLFMFFVGM